MPRRGFLLGFIAVSSLVAAIGIAVLILIYPPHALDRGLEEGCRKVRNAIGQPVATACDTQSITTAGTTSPENEAATDQPNPSTGARVR